MTGRPDPIAEQVGVRAGQVALALVGLLELTCVGVWSGLLEWSPLAALVALAVMAACPVLTIAVGIFVATRSARLSPRLLIPVWVLSFAPVCAFAGDSGVWPCTVIVDGPISVQAAERCGQLLFGHPDRCGFWSFRAHDRTEYALQGGDRDEWARLDRVTWWEEQQILRGRDLAADVPAECGPERAFGVHEDRPWWPETAGGLRLVAAKPGECLWLDPAERRIYAHSWAG